MHRFRAPVRSVTRSIGGMMVALLLTAVLAVPSIGGATRAPSALAVTSEVGGLNKPWDLAFTPDGTLLFTEKVGRINARVEGANVVMATPADVLVAGEGGMMGLAVDPEFTTNRRIYTCFLSRAEGRPDDVRVVRWTVASDYSSLSGRADIVTGIAVNTDGELGRHSGCRPRFGPDGYLWIGTGDAATGSHPQDPDSLAGKVLRVDTDGSGAPGNAGEPFREEIYTYGHRNVQGIAFRPSDGKPYSVEHGTGCDDEVNALVSGANYGWDPVPDGGGDGYDESKPMTDLVAFPDAIEAVWSSGCPTVAPSGATFLSGAQWSDWDDALAVAVLKDTELMVLRLTPSGNDVLGTDIRIPDRGRLRTAVQGPDGNLYLSQDAFPGAILKVVPTPAPSGCGAGASGPFSDVAGEHPFCVDIEWLAAEGITGGFPDGTFRPTSAVTRQSMAAFLYRFAGEPAFVPPAVPSFPDVPVDHPFFEEIEWLADEGITGGFDDDTFRPGSPVTRQSMAAFLYRFAGEPTFVPPATAVFPDVPTDHPFYLEIEWLADEGITGGFPDGTFRPGAVVTRQSMAAFLHRAEDLV